MAPGSEVDAVCVDYRTPRLAASCLAALGRDGLASRTLVEVEPLAPAPGPAAGARASHRLRVPNRGFAAAANAGARIGRAPFLLFLNADCRPAPGLLDGLLAAARSRPRVGAVGPRLVDHAGRETVSHGHDLASPARLLDRLGPRPARGLGPVDWASGACLLVRRTAFEAVGGFCERFFLYCEDADLCRRLWARGYAVLHEPRVLAEHEGGASQADASLRADHYRRGRETYLARHAGPLARSAWRLWLVLTGQPLPSRPAGGKGIP